MCRFQRPALFSNQFTQDLFNTPRVEPWQGNWLARSYFSLFYEGDQVLAELELLAQAAREFIDRRALQLNEHCSPGGNEEI